MEKAVDIEERIRRAEEIYKRRKLQGIRMPSNTVNISTKPDISLFKKTIIKIFFCVILYLFLYVIKNSGYFFSSDVINKTKEILSYDINFEFIFNETSKYLGNIFYKYQDILGKNQSEGEQKDYTEEYNQNEENNSTSEENIEKNDDIEIKDDEESLNNKQEEIKDLSNENENKISNEIMQDNLGIGGTDEKISSDKENLNQMDIDAKYIKDNFNVSSPIDGGGVITSKFGLRTPTNIISANHAGIDIGASEGTIIKAAMDGKVTFVSENRRLSEII